MARPPRGPRSQQKGSSRSRCGSSPQGSGSGGARRNHALTFQERGLVVERGRRRVVVVVRVVRGLRLGPPRVKRRGNKVQVPLPRRALRWLLTIVTPVRLPVHRGYLARSSTCLAPCTPSLSPESFSLKQRILIFESIERSLERVARVGAFRIHYNG